MGDGISPKVLRSGGPVEGYCNPEEKFCCRLAAGAATGNRCRNFRLWSREAKSGPDSGRINVPGAPANLTSYRTCRLSRSARSEYGGKSASISESPIQQSNPGRE